MKFSKFSQVERQASSEIPPEPRSLQMFTTYVHTGGCFILFYFRLDLLELVLNLLRIVNPLSTLSVISYLEASAKGIFYSAQDGLGYLNGAFTVGFYYMFFSPLI